MTLSYLNGACHKVLSALFASHWLLSPKRCAFFSVINAPLASVFDTIFKELE